MGLSTLSAKNEGGRAHSERDDGRAHSGVRSDKSSI